MSLDHDKRTRGARLAALVFGLGLALALAISCTGNRPTVTPAPTLDVVGTVTALARPGAATQTAFAASATQAAGGQATTAAQASAEAATQTAGQAAATAAAQQATAAAATVQVAAATQTARAQAAAAEAGTATALANALASQGATATALAAANATAFARATALAAATPTPVPPTSTPTPLPTAACVPANNAFASIIGKAATAGLDIGCTTGAAFSLDQTAGALQEFWANAANPDPATQLHSLMIWRGDTRTIYVIKGQDTQTSQGTVSSYGDTYQDGQPDVPPACASLTPPAGYQMPLRGFGKVWCDNKLDSAIGWPNRNETNATVMMQATQRGLLMKVSAPATGLGYLIAFDFGSKRAVTTQQ